MSHLICRVSRDGEILFKMRCFHDGKFILEKPMFKYIQPTVYPADTVMNAIKSVLDTFNPMSIRYTVILEDLKFPTITRIYPDIKADGESANCCFLFIYRSLSQRKQIEMEPY